MASDNQNPLFDISGKEFNVYWVDEKQPLFIPNNHIHWKAHKLQIMLQRLEIHAEKNPAQFNSRNYMDILNEYDKLITDIKKGLNDESGKVAQDGNEGTTEEMGNRSSVGVHSGISADNPFAG